MKESERLKQEALSEDNDLKAMGLHIKSNREKRGEDFKEEYLPKLLEKGYYVESDEYFTKYTINTDTEEDNSLRYGIIDFFPKKNKILIRKDNRWIEGGRNWIIKNLL